MLAQRCRLAQNRPDCCTEHFRNVSQIWRRSFIGRKHPSRDVIVSGQNLDKICQKLSYRMTSLRLLKQVLSASRDMIISGQICSSKLQKKVFTLGDGCWLPISCFVSWGKGQRESNMHRIEVHHFASPFAPISRWGKTVDSYRRPCRNYKTSLETFIGRTACDSREMRKICAEALSGPPSQLSPKLCEN